jgi:hypothetical protein
MGVENVGRMQRAQQLTRSGIREAGVEGASSVARVPDSLEGIGKSAIPRDIQGD